MSKWSDWVDIEIAKSKQGLFVDFGIYQIRATTKSNRPILINRLVGADSLGILDIGRSGYRRQNNHALLPTEYESSSSRTIRVVLRMLEQK
jgi:hypothetical protein